MLSPWGRFAIASLLVCAFPAAASDRQWIEIRSPHFSVITDGGEKRGREVGLRFEQMRAVFGTLISRDSVNIPIPLQIIGFRNTKELHSYGPVWRGKPVEVAGFFQAGEDRQFIALDLNAENNWQTVFHEYAHLLLNGNFEPVQPWFDEGFAEYYSTITFSGKEVMIGNPPPGTVQLLLAGRIPCEQLFATAHEDRTYNESGERRQLFYAQSWLMVHYLFDLKKLKETQTYFHLVRQGLSISDAIQRSFGMAPKELDKALDRYLHSSQALLYKAPLPPAIKDIAFTATILSDADAQTALADLHLHSPEYADNAIREFQLVLQGNPSHAGAHRGLGYAWLRKGDFDKAASEFEVAAAQNSSDPWVHYYSALLKYRRGHAGPEELSGIIQQLEKAVALNPQFADAYSLLGWARQSRGDTKAAVADLEHAVQLSPRNEHYQFNLAMALMADREFARAKAVLERLTASNDTQIAGQANRSLKLLDDMQRPLQVAGANNGDITAPQWRGTVATSGREKTEPEPKPAAVDSGGPVRYVKGTVVAIACPADGSALVTINAGKTTWKMRVGNRKKLLLIGADQFDCSWRNRTVSANFRATGPGEGNLVSLSVF